MITGRCECGAVSFKVEAALETVAVCHCSQCRRMSGHVWASTDAPFASVTFSNDEGLAWYASSDFAVRGFCNRCGSSLFYRVNGEEEISIAAGCLDDTSALRTGKHIFIADKGDYYPMPDDAPLFQQSK